jgi:hypothetical protein
VGFGISRPEQVAAVGRLADGVVVGSAIVRLVEQHGESARLAEVVGDFIAALKEPLKVGSAAAPRTPPGATAPAAAAPAAGATPRRASGGR